MAKIILVEDEINIASFIERGLREFGHEVSVVYDGNTGWELLQNESFDLLILDIIMPGMNGLELCRMYRQRFSNIEDRTGTSVKVKIKAPSSANPNVYANGENIFPSTF